MMVLSFQLFIQLRVYLFSEFIAIMVDIIRIYLLVFGRRVVIIYSRRWEVGILLLGVGVGCFLW